MSTTSRLRLPLLAIAVVFPAFSAGRAFANQSRQAHMQNAVNALRNAHSELRQAEANKGGYRGQAQDLVTQALNEVEAGIAYAGGI